VFRNTVIYGCEVQGVFFSLCGGGLGFRVLRRGFALW